MLRVALRPEAVAELTEAIDWYESRAAGLGSEFLRSFEASVAALQRNPQLHPKVWAEARRATLRRFPYGVIYVEDADAILIVACMHFRRHPRQWQARL
ncbi:MAG: type II toxin-antitoxin system RelE/ParE family toxin [Rhodanobacter sp.]